jgi:phosphoribosylamine-glycine ligase
VGEVGSTQWRGRLAQSSLLDELYVCPGNPGTVRHGRNVELDLKDQKKLRAFLVEKNGSESWW